LLGFIVTSKASYAFHSILPSEDYPFILVASFAIFNQYYRNWWADGNLH